MRRLLLAGMAIALAATPAVAEPWVFSGTVQAQLGYGTNPFLVNGVNEGAAFGSISVAPTLTKRTARSTTDITGSYYREQYFNDYGHNDTAIVGIDRTQQITQRLSGTAQANFVDTDNALLSPGYDSSLVDVLTTGQHTRIYSGSLGLSWAVGARDTVSGSVNASHATYGSNRQQLIASNYTQYGGTLSYYHTFSARTQAGVIGTYSRVTSDIYPDSYSVQPALALKQALSDIWQFNGDLGVIFTHVEGPYGGNSTGVGFHAELCGKYPRRRICFRGSRQTAASGIGGLRTDLQGEITYSQDIDEKQTITFSALYDNSRAQDTTPVQSGFLNLPRQQLAQGRIDYTRNLTTRLAAGASARFQWRDYSGYGNAHAVGGSVNLIYRFGHVS